MSRLHRGKGNTIAGLAAIRLLGLVGVLACFMGTHASIEQGQSLTLPAELTLSEAGADQCAKVPGLDFCKDLVTYESPCGATLMPKDVVLYDYVAGENYKDFIKEGSTMNVPTQECIAATKNYCCAAAFPRCGVRSCAARSRYVSVCQSMCLAQAVKCGVPTHRCINVNNKYPPPPKCTSIGDEVDLVCETPRGLAFCPNIDYPIHTDPTGGSSGKMMKWLLLDSLARTRYSEIIEARNSEKCKELKKRLVCSKTFMKCDKSQNVKPICRDLCYEVARECNEEHLIPICHGSHLYSDDYDCTLYGTSSGWHTFLVLFVAAMFTTLLGVGVVYARKYIQESTSSIQYQILNNDDVDDLDFELEQVDNPFASRGLHLSKDIELQEAT